MMAPPEYDNGSISGEGIQVHFHADGRIIEIVITTIQREPLDRLAQWLSQRIQAWEPDVPYLALYDLSQPGAMFTPYMRKLTADLNDSTEHVIGRVALVMKRDTTASLTSMFALNRPNTHRPIRVFFRRDVALEWLIAGMPPAL